MLRKIWWIIIIISFLLLGLYALYDPFTFMVNDFILKVAGPTVYNAFYSLYSSIVYSPFWQATIAPIDWIIGTIFGLIVGGLLVYKAPVIRSKTSAVKKDYLGGPVSVPPAVITESTAKTVETATGEKETA
jgi:hypothetical protein